ncbi:EAL domain-containing protein [Alteromonas sp. 5E99-2]|uniref:EAL domain-containing protein n=1 Tax=Alteromonas sp. 5E99-2 TaxID=2817683 RepID=UPI001A99DF71|nr:EAL domain-containing protein [Alteromonas sp. 5E99-2]MBO1256095.1 EAL domain-containing protein [Alteromonas sp. 5E99-2]
MQQRKIDLLLITAVSLIFAFIGIAIVSVGGITLINKENQQFVDRILMQVETLTKESASTLTHLANNRQTTCDSNYLHFLQQVMFQGHYIKDIGYYGKDNTIVCSTSLGVLESPIEKEEQGFTTPDGVEIVINSPLMLFDLDYSAFRMKNDSFFVVTEFEEILSDENPMQDWQLVYRPDEQFIPVLGTPNSYANYSENSSQQSKGLTDLVVEQCLDSISFCVVSRFSLFDLIGAKVSIFLFLIFMSSGIFGYLAASRALSHRNSMAERIKRGLKCTNFFPLFQPIVDLKTNKIIGCEVLARYSDNAGPLYPDEFIPLLPQLDLTLPFTTKLIKTAVAELTAQDDIPNGFKINLNLFPSDITKDNITDFMAAAANTKDFNICFEITEDATFNTPEALSNLARLRRQGFTVAIDDFGTGYANLGQLQNLEFDFLKIDRSFIMALEGDNVKSTLIPTIISLAEQLDVTLVAEGVETENQASILKNLNTGLGQGWLFGKPMPAEDLSELTIQTNKNN